MESLSVKAAIAEGLLDRIKREDWSSFDIILKRSTDVTGDDDTWPETLRYELALPDLTQSCSGLLHNDIVLPRLASNCDLQTMSVFHYAALRGADQVLRLFLGRRVPADVALHSGTTALHLAAFAGKTTTVKLLVDEFGADVNREDRSVEIPVVVVVVVVRFKSLLLSLIVSVCCCRFCCCYYFRSFTDIVVIVIFVINYFRRCCLYY